MLSFSVQVMFFINHVVQLNTHPTRTEVKRCMEIWSSPEINTVENLKNLKRKKTQAMTKITPRNCLLMLFFQISHLSIINVVREPSEHSFRPYSVALHVITNFLIVSSPHKLHQGIWHVGLNNGVGTPHISRNGPFHTAGLPPLSAWYTNPSTERNSNLLQSQTTRNCYLLQNTSPTNQITGSHLPDYSYKL